MFYLLLWVLIMAENLAENELNQVADSNNNEIIENNETVANAETVSEIAESITDSEVKAAPVDDAPKDTPVVPTMTEEQIAAKKAADEQKEAEKAARAKERQEQLAKYDVIYEQLKGVKEANGTIEVKVIERIRGGLRVVYQEMPMFLPASHFGLKRNPTEQSMKEAIGDTFLVHIHELQEDETKRKTVIVSRKQILEEKFWSSLKVGEVIEGPITSIAAFGIFIDVYGIEGLVHVTRLSNTRIENLKEAFKKGQIMKAVIVDINKEQKRIGLSTKELEESPWKGLSQEFKDGAIIKGIVRRITDFGAYIEMKPGIDGLLRTNELSWTLRISNPNDVLTIGQEIEVYVMNVSEDKKTAALSLKRIQENPWKAISEKYPIKVAMKGTIKQLTQQGAIINLNEEVDGFMPRSRMRFLPKDSANVGTEVEVIIDNIDLEKESMIILPANEEIPQFKPRERENKPRSERAPRYNNDQEASISSVNDSPSVTLLDLLSESAKKNLLKS